MNWTCIRSIARRSTETSSKNTFDSLHSLSFVCSLLSTYRDLEASVEELQNDVKSKHCHVTMNDVESFALVLSSISRSLVDLKGKLSGEVTEIHRCCLSFASFISSVTRENLCIGSSIHYQRWSEVRLDWLAEGKGVSITHGILRFLLDSCMKNPNVWITRSRNANVWQRCSINWNGRSIVLPNRRRSNDFHSFRLAINHEPKPVPTRTARFFSLGAHGKAVDRKRLLDQIESVTQNSDGRVKAIEVNHSAPGH